MLAVQNESITYKGKTITHKCFYSGLKNYCLLSNIAVSNFLLVNRHAISKWRKALIINGSKTKINGYEFIVLRIIDHMINQRSYNIKDFNEFDWSSLQFYLDKYGMKELEDKLFIFDFKNMVCHIVNTFADWKALKCIGKAIHLKKLLNAHFISLNSLQFCIQKKD